MSFNTTPLSTTVLSVNQFPVSAVYVPGTSSGNLTALAGGPALSADINGNISAPVLMYLNDGFDVAQGLTSDPAITGDTSGTISAKLRGLNKIFAQLQFDGSNFLKVNVAAGTVAATQSGTWNINNISGTISLPTGASQDSTIAKLNIAQSTALGSNTGPMIQGSVTTSSPTYITGNIDPLSLTTAGALRVDGSSTVQPVSGTFWQATQPISVASLPLPTGAATSAKQPALGTAGSASTDVLTVQGITSMTPLKVDGSATTQPISGTVTANAGTGNFTVIQGTASNLNAQVVGSVASAGNNAGNPVKVGGAYNTTQPTVTTGQIVDTQMTARGAQIVATGVDAFAVNASQSGTWNITNVSGTVSLPTGAATSAKQPTLGTAGTASSDVLTVQGIASMTALKVDGSATTQPISGTVTANAGSGTFNNQQTNITTDYDTGAGTQTMTMFGLALPASGGAVSGGTSSNPLKIDPTGTTIQPVSGTVTANQGGTWNITNVSGTVSLPTGAATSAKQPALGTAGSASSDVITIQGITSMTALKVDGSGVTQPISGTVTANVGTTNGLALDTSINGVLVSQGSTTSGEKGPLVQGAVTTSAPTYTTAQTSPISLTTAGAVRVDASATTQPVSGTLTANQGGTWTVQPGNTANTTAWKVDGSAVTQPVSGTITANIGTTNGVALDTSVNGVLLTQGSTTSGEKGPLVQGAVTTGAPAYTTAQTSPISLTTAGAVRVDGSATTQPVSGTVTANAGTGTFNIQSNASVNVAQIAGSSVATAAAGIMKVGLTDGTGTAITSTSNAIDVNIKSGGGSGFSVTDEAAWTAGTSAFVPAGGVFNDTAAALTTGQEGSIRLTNNRAIHVNLRDASANQLLGSKTSANSIPVVIASDQAAVPASQSGTWNITNISGTISLPTGAATSAKQPALGTAGTASSDVLTVQGIASMTALKVDGSAVTQPVSGTVTANIGTTNGLALDTSVNGVIVTQGSTTSGEKGPLVQGAVTTGSPTYTTAQTSPISLTTAGAVRVDASATTQPVSGTVTANQGGTWTVQPGNTANTTAWKVDGSAVTQPVSGTVTANAGTGNFTVVQATGSNLHAVLDSGSTTAVTQATASNLNAQVVGAAASGASNTGNPVKHGGVFNTTQPTVTTGQVVDAQYTARGAQIVATGVDAFAVNASQSGTWNITNVSGTVSLPTGASTSAKQPALGTAGTASSDVLTVQGIASMTALKVDGSAVTQPVSGTVTANIGTSGSLALDTSVNGILLTQGSTTSGQKGPLNLAAVTTNAPSYTTAQSSPLSLDTSGLLRVSLKDTPANTTNLNVALAASSATVTVSGTITANAGTNLNTSLLALETGGNLATLAGTVTSAKVQTNVAQINGVAPTMGNGVSGTGVQRVTLASDSTGQVALASGANTIGAVTQASGPWTNNVTQFGSNNVATGTGASGVGIPRVTVSNDSEIQLWDGTNGPVAVKVANTPATLVDKSIVQTLSPNNTGLPINIPAIVQSTNNKSSGSVASLAKAFVSNNVAGNSIIVVCAVGNGTAPTISDTASNTYTQAKQIANGTALNMAIFYAVGIASGANTITVNNGGTTASIAMEIYEVSGLIAQIQAQPDQTASATGSSGTAATPVISALTPNEYAFAGIGVGTAAQTITVGSGWTNDSGQQNPTTPAGLFSFVSMSQYLGSLKGVTPQATFTSEPWAIAVATFRPVILGVEATTRSISVSNATVASVAGSASSVTLFASNSAAQGRIVVNDSTSSLYLAYAATATTSAYTVLLPSNAYWEMPQPIYTGAVSGIWASATGNARLSETS